jgi:hypothetical protein
MFLKISGRYAWEGAWQQVGREVPGEFAQRAASVPSSELWRATAGVRVLKPPGAVCSAEVHPPLAGLCENSPHSYRLYRRIFVLLDGIPLVKCDNGMSRCLDRFSNNTRCSMNLSLIGLIRDASSADDGLIETLASWVY